MNSCGSPLLWFLAFSCTVGCSPAGNGAPGGGVEAGGTSAVTGGTGGTTGIPTSGTGGATAGTGAVIDPGHPPEDNPECDSVLEVTYRDFTEAHPDFEMDFRGDVVRRGLVSPELSAERKPVFLNNVGCPADTMTPLACANWTTTTPVLSTAEAFAQWYTDVPDVNMKLEKELALTESAPNSGEYVYDSSSFFPLEPTEGFGPSPMGHYTGNNYLFTTEIHVQFGYRAGQVFTFRGDDDLWIFVNGKLALDLGSLHGPEQGTIDFDAQAGELGISVGQTYAMDIFHAERHTDGSNFRVTTNISCFTDVVVR
ncbi:MAG TPA: fibro-slime domain-containing protein [Polyangiaceae bacterium]